jgi:hypothetical protein
MKKCIISLVFVLALATAALAGTVEFSKLTVDVPDGWTASEQDKLIALTAPKNVAAISIVWDNTDGIPGKDLAKAMSAELKGTTPVLEDGSYTFTFKNKNGIVSQSILMADKKEYMMLTITGEHPQLARVLKSIKEK